jgi:hypothetical protein
VPVAIPHYASLNVSGNGWDLLRKSVGLKLPLLKIPLEKPTEVKKIPGSTLISLVSGQLGSLQINYVVGDTLGLEIDLKDSHKFLLVADLDNIFYKKGYGRISPVVILPDSVEIEGPKSILHNFPDSIVLPLSKNKVSDYFRQEVEVVVPDGNLVKRNPPVVDVHFEVGEIVEVDVKLPVEIIRVSSRLTVASSVDSVMCRITLPKKSGLEILKAQPLKAVITSMPTDKGEYLFKPRVEGLPPLAHLIKVDSVVIRFN